MRVLVLASGGMESSWVAYERLLATDDQVALAFFTTFLVRTSAGWRSRYEAEALAVRGVAAWLTANVRPVSLEQHELLSFRYRGWWATEVVLWAAEQCNAGRFDEVLTGWNGSESRAEQSLGPLQQRAFYGHAERGRLVFPLGQAARADIYFGMPAGLRKLTVSCVNARVVSGSIVACGHCQKCERVKILERAAAEGLDAARLQYAAALEEQARWALDYLHYYPDCELFKEAGA